MNKRLLISLLALTMSFHLAGCTSSDSSKDTEESVVSSDDSFSEENSGEFSEGESSEAQASNEDAAEGGETVDDTALNEGQPTAEAAPAEGGEAAATDELALDDGGDPANEFPDEVASTENPTAETAPADAAAETTDTAATDTPPADQQPSDQALFDQQPTDTASTEPPPADATTDTTSTDVAASDTATADTTTMDSTSTDVAASEVPVEAPKAYLPLLKVKDAPFEQGGTVLNRYYIAREGDTAKSVSQKIYGSNRSKDLRNWNPFLKNRPMKVGDKIYYNSPKDPADSSRMIGFYEEQGLTPSTYVTKENEDIREVSKSLLGSKDSWKEIWATNMDVESKGSLPAGTELRYFPQDAETAVASNNQPAAPAQPPTDVAANNQALDQGLPPDDPTLNPPQDFAANNPQPDLNAAGQVAPPPDAGMAPPPPPPPADQAAMAPPPPPIDQAPPPKPTTRAAAADEDLASDPDQTMMLGAAGLLLLGGVLAFSVIRRKRASKRIDMTQTQI